MRLRAGGIRLTALRIARMAQGIRRVELARATDLSESTLGRIERGDREARPNERRAIARALGLGVRETFPREAA